MYNVAYVDDSKCIADKGCVICIMYCPEADCIHLDTTKMKAVVNIQRCKGCELCKVVCSTHHAVSMHPVNVSTGEIILEAEETETAALGQAYAG